MEDKPRYSRMSDMINLLLLMQERVQGVSIKDVMTESNVSRRTAERMIESLKMGVPAIEEIPNHNSREKYWGFPTSVMRELIHISPEEIANLEKIKEFQIENGFKDKAEMLDKTISSLKAFGRQKRKEIDEALELIMQTEGFAVRQMPKYKFDVNLLETVRDAMKQNRKVKAVYNGKEKLFAPYGIIYGAKVYLIGVEGDKEMPYCYLLHKFSKVRPTFDTFDKGDFKLDEFAKKSFGIYQGEAIDVKLLFEPSAANDVLNYHFHSTQKMKQNEDGSVTVKFKASGEFEIMWHLFRWGTDVKIIAPASLRKQYIELLEGTLQHQKEK